MLELPEDWQVGPKRVSPIVLPAFFYAGQVRQLGRRTLAPTEIQTGHGLQTLNENGLRI